MHCGAVDALQLKSTRSYTYCMWSCSDRTDATRSRLQ